MDRLITALIIFALLAAFGLAGTLDYETQAAIYAEYPLYFKPHEEFDMAVKPRRIKSAASAVPVAQSREDVVAYISEIGRLDRDLSRIEAEMNDEMAVTKERHETRAAPLSLRKEQLSEGVQIWCEANRDRLTQNGKVKTAAFASGEVMWRLPPPSVKVKGVDAVLDALRRAKLTRFIRTKEEINKEAILNEQKAVAAIPGITISQGEDFVITPFEAELAEGM